MQRHHRAKENPRCLGQGPAARLPTVSVPQEQQRRRSNSRRIPVSWVEVRTWVLAIEEVDRAGRPRLARGRLALGMRAVATDSARTANTHQVPCQAHALIEVAEFKRFASRATDPCRPHGVRFHSLTVKRSMRCASFPDAIHVRNQRFERMCWCDTTWQQGMCGNALLG